MLWATTEIFLNLYPFMNLLNSNGEICYFPLMAIVGNFMLVQRYTHYAAISTPSYLNIPPIPIPSMQASSLFRTASPTHPRFTEV